jgi:hypothetical protein
MSKKIQKLKEINSQIEKMLIEMEAHVFVACADDIKKIKSKKEPVQAIAEPKQ